MGCRGKAWFGDTAAKSPPPALAIAKTTKSHADHQPHAPQHQPPRLRRQQPDCRSGDQRAAERHYRSAHGEPHRLRRSRRKWRRSAHGEPHHVRRNRRTACPRGGDGVRGLRARRGGGEAVRRFFAGRTRPRRGRSRHRREWSLRLRRPVKQVKPHLKNGAFSFLK